jgi:hypothetical protein
MSDETIYSVNFYIDEDQVLSYYSYAPPNININDVVYFHVMDQDAGNYRIKDIKYSFLQRWTRTSTNIYVEIYIEKIEEET